MSPIRRCSSKGKSIPIASGSTNSESSGSPLVGRPRAIKLRGKQGPRFPTGADLAELNDQERCVVPFSIELENQEASANINAKEKDPSEKGPDFRLADFLPMRWTGTDFEFAEEINPEKVRRFSVKKNHKWENQLPTRSCFKSVRRLVLQTDPPAGFTFLIPDEHQRPWAPPVGYACVHESWFNNCRLWWPLPELMTTYCSRRKITLGQYTGNGIRIMVALMVLAEKLDITMSVHLFEELTTPSITAKIGFFYGKMVPKYNVLTGKPSKVNHWNQSYCYVKINEASFEDPSVILNEYFNANIGCSDSFWEQVEASRTLSHQHWPNISETHIQAALNRIVRAREHPVDEMGSQAPSPRLDEEPDVRSSPLESINQTEMAMVSGDPTLEGELPEENQGSSPPAPQGDEVVEYPHLVDFHYHHIEILFAGDYEAPAQLFHQIKLNKSLKKKENAKMKGKWDMSKEKVGQITTEKDQAMEMAEMEKSRGDLLSKEKKEIKAQKKILESRLRELEQEKVEEDSKFEMTTKRLRQSREHEVRKERLRVEAAMKQQMMPVYEKMHQYLDEQPAIQSKLVLYSQANGAIEGLDKSQALGMSIDEVLE
ncbi:hypothetical protein N665_0215s0007 [Sinapis alba]|nr:hypothetical protein N665_0215s0007 [Sinapis alba]